MCGIIAILGNRIGFKICMDGLKMLQNRGYDSSGVCSLSLDGKLVCDKFASTESVSSIEKVEKCEVNHKDATVLCMHTRWATHGGKTDENAHPHIDFQNKFALVHNGIIENYYELKQELIKNHNIKFDEVNI